MCLTITKFKVHPFCLLFMFDSLFVFVAVVVVFVCLFSYQICTHYATDNLQKLKICTEMKNYYVKQTKNTVPWVTVMKYGRY